MKNNENIDRKIEAAFNSIDNIKRATPKIFLLTRINARLGNQAKSFWDNAALFMSRPVVMVSELFIVVPMIHWLVALLGAEPGLSAGILVSRL